MTNIELHQLANEWLKHLPNGWLAKVREDTDWRFWILDPKGRQVMIDVSDKDKYRVSGSWPSGPHGTIVPDDRPKGINISKSRGVEAAVKDIMRRYYPAYTKAYDVAEKQALDLHRYIRRRKQLAKHFAALVGEELNDMRAEAGDFTCYNGAVTRIRVHNTDEIDITVRVPKGLAEKVIELVADA